MYGIKAIGSLVRRLGAFERLYQRRGQKNTMHLCMVAERADHLDPFTPCWIGRK